MGKEEQAPARKRKKPGTQPAEAMHQQQQQRQQQQQQLQVPEQQPPKKAGKRGPAEGQRDVAEQAAKKARRTADKQPPASGPHAADKLSRSAAAALHQKQPHAARSGAAAEKQHRATNKPSSADQRNLASMQPPKPASAPKHQQPGSVHPALHSNPAATPKHAFQVDDPRDHAETPFEAYRDLEPLLFRLAQQLGKTKASLRIYDPYFCAGSCVAHLSRLGFSDVYNRNEDFYSSQALGRCPDFDVLVTNPPFSGDHMRRALDFAARCGRPWALLMPDFVARKGYYAEVLDLAGVPGNSANAPPPSPAGPYNAVTSPLCGPLHYLAPATQPYKFSAPRWHTQGVQGAGAAPQAGKIFTPASFQCVWFLALGASHAVPVTAWWRKKHGAGAPAAVSGCVLSGEVRGLPQLSLDPNRKRREEEAGKRSWRKKLSRQRKNAAKAQAGAS